MRWHRASTGPRSPLARVASDHLPLKATIDIPAAQREMRGHEGELVLNEAGA